MSLPQRRALVAGEACKNGHERSPENTKWSYARSHAGSAIYIWRIKCKICQSLGRRQIRLQKRSAAKDIYLRYSVKLSCTHENVYPEPKPKIGDAVFCLKCEDRARIETCSLPIRK